MNARTVAVAAASLAAGVALGALALRRAPTVLDAERQEGRVVATFAGREMKASAVEAQLRAQPQAVRERFASDEGRKDYVEGLVRLDLLARLAVEKGYDRDPEFVRRLKQELATAYLEKEFEEPQKKAAPTDEELRQHFEANLAKIHRPERLRLAVVAFRAEDDEARRHKRPFAQAALAEARRRRDDYYAFGEIARQRSEEPKSAATSGELPPMSRAELEAGFGPTLAAKAFAMPRKPGALLDEVVEGERGLFVVKLLAVEPPYEPKLEDVRESLRAQLTTERHAKALEAFLEAAWKAADVKIDPQALKQLKVPAAAEPARK